MRVAINGMGRIGRATLKIVMEQPELELVGTNDLSATESIAYLLKYDSVYGRYEKTISSEDAALVVEGKRISMSHESDPERLPWRELGVDLVFECTGAFTKADGLAKHIKAGAKMAILSAPSKGEDIPTVVHGVNLPGQAAQIFSCASCTTNCITPVIEILGRRVGIHKAIMTTVHAYTASQSLVDKPSRHPRRGRAGAANLVPASTGAAVATTRALPEYRGLFDGVAIRAPVPVGSIADIVVLARRKTSADEVNSIFREESQTDRYREVVGVSDDPIVSADIVQDSRASIVDLAMTQVVDGDLVKVMSWYDNEWGYSCQMVREAVRIAASQKEQVKKAG